MLACMAWPCYRLFSLAVSVLGFSVTPGLVSVQQLRVLFKAVYLHVQSPLILSTPSPLSLRLSLRGSILPHFPVFSLHLLNLEQSSPAERLIPVCIRTQR